MKTQIPHELTHATDPNGRPVVGVRLSNRSKSAWLDLKDYLRITAEHGTPAWYLNSNGSGRAYVRFRQSGTVGRKMTVARLVAGDFEKTGVVYLDSDPLNLRQANLVHDKGRGLCPGRHSGFTGLLIATSKGVANV